MYPPEGVALAEPPQQVQLRFNEPIEAEFSPLKVADQRGNRVDEDDARISSNDARLLLTDLQELPEGSYTVEWRVASADGHPVSGTYSFSVDALAADAQEGAGEPIEPVEQRSSKHEEEGSQEGGVIRAAVLGVVLIGALAVAGFVVLRRR